ncbi:hypothetical protein [Candidatus Mycobacterium methanotrophicum]|uniref:Uncharacterized protein n=1 Tax=Candidatus Mycobacterium methanotrophicum TaxID=2943498 RepID=A0ABY4QMD1_9MYCO|nr:hypothetical protein [Candidatus Mycobacterium methanotrophicum]UQX11786.1 hypothetical protein M5I08_04990 [Candidatus Mycobacterium methanotrophicum]
MAGYEPLGDLSDDHVTFEIGTLGDLRIDLFLRVKVFRGQIRWFCLGLWMESTAGRFELERVDCCDSELHRHRFYQHRSENRVKIYELSPGDERIVDTAYQMQYEYLITNWEQIVDRWHRAH